MRYFNNFFITGATYTLLAAFFIMPVAVSAQAGYGGGGGGWGAGPVVFGDCPSGFVLNQATNTCNPAIYAGRVLGASTSTVATAPRTFKFLINFRRGSRLAPDVTKLQEILMEENLLLIAAPTGYFGPKTLAAVKEYQAARGIPATGNVFILTRTALNTGI